jgi:hypothetical protein
MIRRRIASITRERPCSTVFVTRLLFVDHANFGTYWHSKQRVVILDTIITMCVCCPLNVFDHRCPQARPPGWKMWTFDGINPKEHRDM